jgi:hypothetical protein
MDACRDPLRPCFSRFRAWQKFVCPKSEIQAQLRNDYPGDSQKAMRDDFSAKDVDFLGKRAAFCSDSNCRMTMMTPSEIRNGPEGYVLPPLTSLGQARETR